MGTHSKAAGVKTCTFVFGERAEQVITSSGFFIQPGHLLFPREVGFCSVLNGACSACKCAENLPRRRNGAHTGSRGCSHRLPRMLTQAPEEAHTGSREGCVPGLSVARLKPSKRAERKTMETEITDVCQDRS